MPLARPSLSSFLLCLVFVPCAVPLRSQAFHSPTGSTVASGNNDPVWTSVRDHEPDLATASLPVVLEQADLLRVRHFPAEAMRFYHEAVRRGAESASVLNKMGLTHLQMRNIVLAESFFRRAVKLDDHIPEIWNNLAALEYVSRQYDAAVSDYKRALKLKPDNPVGHANLSTALFEMKRYAEAQREAGEALRLDPAVYSRRDGLMILSHALPAGEQTKMFLNMAKVYARAGRDADALQQLAGARQLGSDVIAQVAKDHDLSRFAGDPRLLATIAPSTAQPVSPSHDASLVTNERQTASLAPMR